MNLEDVKTQISTRMKTLLQRRSWQASRREDAADVCATTVQVVMEYVTAQHADMLPDERRIEAERVAAFLGWCWFPKLEVEPAELLAAMKLETVRALRASAEGAYWSELAALELKRRETGSTFRWGPGAFQRRLTGPGQ